MALVGVELKTLVSEPDALVLAVTAALKYGHILAVTAALKLVQIDWHAL